MNEQGTRCRVPWWTGCFSADCSALLGLEREGRVAFFHLASVHAGDGVKAGGLGVHIDGAQAIGGVLDGDLLSERALARPIDSTAACPFLSALIACKGLILFRVPQQPLRSFGPFPL